MKKKQILMKEYNKIMDRIIKKGKSIEETLIEMLEKAGKYEIIEK